MKKENPIIELKGVKNYLGGRWVHDGIDLSVYKGEIVAIIGPSGCGKTTLLRCILMLLRPTAGSIKLFGIDTLNCSEAQAQFLRKKWGMMFQSGALFSSLTVLENVMFPLQEYAHLSRDMQREIALLKISMVGLNLNAAIKFPSEISGGMTKRVATARAIAHDPELLFLDEPTSGLDPKSSDGLDDLILYLRDNLGLTVVLVTHDLDTLWRVPDRIIYLDEGKALMTGTIEELMNSDHPSLRAYFSGPRADAHKKRS